MTAFKPGSRFDLHLHSSNSDGKFAPDEVLEKCADAGLDVVALTDHDLPARLETGPRTVNGRRLHVIGGAEVSGVHEGRELHLLVYFPHGVPGPFHDFCRSRCQERAVRFERAMAALALTGKPIDPLAVSGERALTRLHMAHLLIEAGIVRSRQEAFAKFLGDAHDTVPKMTLPFVEAIQVARAHGGITSWAHPGRADVEAHLSAFVQAGLQGLEGLRPHLNARDRRFFRKVARQHGLFLTGGSDWHGWHAPAPGLFRVHAAEIRGFVDTILAA